jgi:flagellin
MGGFTIITNVPSLGAQNNLSVTNRFQATTIQRLSSGLRINNSGDDAAGLAIANRLRSDITVLQQGIRNANDGLSTLQVIDGGLNNISLLLDRGATLAAQSASGTFNGDRNTLNIEFVSLLEEIDREAQAIGLNPGGEFNDILEVFIGGGRDSGSITAISNGSVVIDLSNSSVSSSILGLQGVQAIGGTPGTTDIGTGSTTSVETIVEEANNLAGLRTNGFTEFIFAGAGFSDDDRVRVSVNLAGVVDTDTLVSAIGDAINGFGATSQAGQAFKNAGITATVNTDSVGGKQLAFISSDSAFQVAAGDTLANALLGNFQAAGAVGQGATLDITVTGANNQFDATADATVSFLVQGAGLVDPVTLSVDVVIADDEAAAFAKLQSAVAANTALSTAGITVTGGGAGAPVSFVNSSGERFEVFTAGDSENVFGFGTFLVGDNAQVLDTSYTGTTAASITEGGVFTIALPGGTPQLVTVAAGAAVTLTTAIDSINAQIASNATLAAAGLVASTPGGTDLTFSSTTGTRFRLTPNLTVAAGDHFGFGDFTPVSATSTLTQPAAFLEHTFISGGAEASTTGDVTSFSPILFGTDDQTVSITANDPTGREQSIGIVLRNDATARTGASLDEAIQHINLQLQQSNNETLQKIVAVKELNNAGTAEGIRLVSTLEEFKVSLSSTPNAGGLNAGAQTLLTSDQLTGGGVADISSKDNAERAVTLISSSITVLGRVQGDVGSAQNTLIFALSLASTQVVNFSAAESRIRDADIALEASNLTKASIRQQAGIAALAQANTAPQSVLALLQG